MAETPEAKVKRSVTDLLDKYNVYYFKPATGGYGRSGVPDIVGCFHGYFIAIECKANGAKPTALQERELKRIYEHGGVTAVVGDDDDLDLLKKSLDTILFVRSSQIGRASCRERV